MKIYGIGTDIVSVGRKGKYIILGYFPFFNLPVLRGLF